jgi:hypothetical protein
VPEHLSPKSIAAGRRLPSAETANPAARQLLMRSDLLEPERKLVELMEDIKFGRIERLQFRDGRPMLQPPPRIIVAVKMTGEDSRADAELRTGSCLKQSLIELFALMQRIGDGELFLIEIRHGFPFYVETEWLGKS